jgi:hypothetical protein
MASSPLKEDVRSLQEQLVEERKLSASLKGDSFYLPSRVWIAINKEAVTVETPLLVYNWLTFAPMSCEVALPLIVRRFSAVQAPCLSLK